MTEIAIYVEGGGDSVHQQVALRQGFDCLLRTLKSEAQRKKLGWKVSFRGARRDAYDAFINALKNSKPDTISVLLVDSEEQIAPVASNAEHDAKLRVEHLARRDHWDFSEVQPDRVHLMVQCMEAWIVADASALKEYYGQHFAPNALPKRQNLEEEAKDDVYRKLRKATSRTQKGEYDKIRDARQLLQRLDPAKVKQRCPRFAVLTRWLEEIIAAL